MKESVKTNTKAKTENPTVSIHDEESKAILYIKKWGAFVLIGICCSIRIRKGSMLIHKIDKLHSHSILYS